MSNPSLIFASVPSDRLPVPGKDLLVEGRSLPAGEGVLVRIELASLDPYLLSQLRDPSSAWTYQPTLPVGEPLSTSAVGTVERSDAPGLPAGEMVWLAMTPLARYAFLTVSVAANRRLVVPIGQLVRDLGIDVGHWLGVLGVPGLTGFAGLYECGKPRAGETIFISSAAGTVGLTVAYFSKRDGLRVVGSAGTTEKVDLLWRTGLFDEAFVVGRRDSHETVEASLRRTAPEGVDIYFASVGGSQMRAAATCMKVHGRIVVCDAVDEYGGVSSTESTEKSSNSWPHAPWLWQPVAYRRLTIRGFIITDLVTKYMASFQEQMYEGIKKDGGLPRIAPLYVVRGLEKAAEAFENLFRSGKVMGKLLVQPCDP
ncbi:zinc-binding dehydrogenase [Colletotrichum graminicola]|uniref:Zinc-binding dehydrogenase n=1 Tax=Colletotrichum graminicola (strain M1.001 / M2 / FGSC 10212) TaxID=645133 RepID=E3Q503_COLGM|nr:zinc-binding dehydrogenase [Colletotrichum graminicola M1.001]EFQ25770.1 zinc-binding dehydrogenase [Colletotrichum graminicola M1.001]WDK22873.1 zinc-binding dehydrogenase [Colletotrichum graminicola]